MDFSIIYRKLFAPLLQLVGTVFWICAGALAVYVLYNLIRYRIVPFRLNARKLIRLRRLQIDSKLFDFLRWKMIDTIYARKRGRAFDRFGLRLYCGRQGSGKTMSAVHDAMETKKRFPNCIIVTNFACSFADRQMESWRDFMDIRNGESGVLFLIDEIHSEYSSASWKDLPESLLSEISQQRKQRVGIFATAQIFGRIAKPLREQAFSVVQCSTISGRWTFNREYDAKDYELFCSSTMQNKRLKPFSKRSFVQNDKLRMSYDTYQKIERMRDREFIPRHQRPE